MIDISKVFKEHNNFKRSMKVMEQDVANFEASIRQRTEDIKKMGEQAKEYGIGSPEYKKLEEQAARLQTDLQLEMSRKRQDFLKREAELFHNTYMEIVSEVTKIASSNNIALVLRHSNEKIDPTDRDSVLKGVNRAVVYENRLQITELVLRSINSRYPPVQSNNNNGSATRPFIPGNTFPK